MSRTKQSARKTPKTAKVLSIAKQSAKDNKVRMIYEGNFVCPVCHKQTAGQRERSIHQVCVDTIGGKKKWKQALISAAKKSAASSSGDVEVDIEAPVAVEETDNNVGENDTDI